MNNKYTIHRLEVEEQVSLSISCREYYSIVRLEIKQDEQYTFKVDTQGPRWWDMVIPTYGEGWDSILVTDKWKRLPGKPLFYLCGCMNDDDRQAFTIGNYLERWSSTQDGMLSFFANDFPVMYFNNWGKLHLIVKRLK